MSLRAAILKAAVPLIPQQGFTRAALSAGLASLPASAGTAGTAQPSSSAPSSAPANPSGASASTAATSTAAGAAVSADARESVLDTLFGPSSDSGRALVSAWEDAGAAAMRPAAGHGGLPADERVLDALQRRLEWSAGVGEYLVDAHALLAASSTSVPLPSPILAALDRVSPSSLARALADAGGRLPLPLPGPGPLAYAWRVADEAVYAAAPDAGRVGVMREPAGAGVEWYAQRIGLAMVYLQAGSGVAILHPPDRQDLRGARLAPLAPLRGATLLALTPESHLLSPPADAPPLPTALASLRDNMGAYARARATFGGLDNAVDGAIGFIELATRSVAGILRSRGF